MTESRGKSRNIWMEFVENGLHEITAIRKWRNSPYEANQDASDYAHCFAARCASRAAKNGSELLAGYLNHEDPRPRSSKANGAWNRTRSALPSVIVI
ncbi:MAG: hypothetical protein ACR2JB_24605 [Bryobacteraceae bacterium]